jgi:hypothetical protein
MARHSADPESTSEYWMAVPTVEELEDRYWSTLRTLAVLKGPRSVATGSFGEVLTRLRRAEQELERRGLPHGSLADADGLVEAIDSADTPLVVAAERLLRRGEANLALFELFESIDVQTLAVAGVASPAHLGARLAAYARFLVSEHDETVNLACASSDSGEQLALLDD